MSALSIAIEIAEAKGREKLAEAGAPPKLREGEAEKKELAAGNDKVAEILEEESKETRREMFKLLLGGCYRKTHRKFTDDDLKDPERWVRKTGTDLKVGTNANAQEIESFYQAATLLAQISSEMHNITTHEAIGVQLAKIQTHVSTLFSELWAIGLWSRITPAPGSIDIHSESKTEEAAPVESKDAKSMSA